jgi:NOL1/NOP2/sun family putative RNA methylase
MTTNLPEGFIKKYMGLIGEEAEDFFRTFQDQFKSGYDLNQLKKNKDTNQEIVEWNPKYGRRGKISGKSIEHVTGVLYSQEPSAQFVGATVNAQKGEKILDVAAAPGGKSFQIASTMENKGILISNEIISKRAKILSENMERGGFANVVVTNHDSEKLADNFPNFFDKVLLDAPCSGEGMFRKDPESISYWHETYSSELSELQKDILSNVVKTVKPGGQLIYSTCTFAPEENEQVISWILDKYPEFSLVPIEKVQGIEDGKPEWGNNNPDLKYTARLWPHKIDGEGHFVAKLVKTKNNLLDNIQVENLTSIIPKKSLEIYRNWEKESLNIKKNNLYTFGRFIYSFPNDTPNSVSILKILRLGVQLGEIKKDRFIPSHSLAISLKKSEVKNSLNISEKNWKQYIHGDVFESNEKNGWYVLFIDDNPTGWGKVTNGQVKNFFPKGLRFQAK